MRRLKPILFAVLLITGFSVLAQKKATISFTAKDYDLGKVKEVDGVKAGKFEFTNTGNDTLKLLSVNSAYANISLSWTKTPVPPKGNGFISANFNPKGQQGIFQREINVVSNDQDQPRLTLMLKGEVEPRPKTEADDYPNPIGNLRFNTSQVAFNNINNTDTKTDTLKVYNDWTKPMSITFTALPEYIKCKAVPENLNPKKKGYILVTYDAGKRKDFGFLNDRFAITTNDSAQAEKNLNVTANIVEDFSKMTPEQLLNAAKIKFESETFNFDTITEGKPVETDFKFSNVGNDDLFIRKVKGS